MKSDKKRILFHLGHPAHFHLFKNIFKNLIDKNFNINILIKKKDVLEELVKNSGFEYVNLLPKGRHDSKLGILWGMIKTDILLFFYCLRNKVDLMVGTSYAISHIGKILAIPSINVNEDDWDAVPFYAKFSYPWATSILTPDISRLGKWEKKAIRYSGYHELTYLHPKYFTPDKSVVKKYLNPDKKYFIIRFAKLGAHHDPGIAGITDEIAEKIIAFLKPYGNVYITSERILETQFKKYCLIINPNDIHHIIAFSTLYIGDSQTMAAEAGILGIPFIRFNDFIGRLSYLDELENKYQLGYGIKTNDSDKIFETITRLINTPDLKAVYERRRNKMLSEKIDVAAFLTWFIENYPKSVNIMKENPDYQWKFK